MESILKLKEDELKALQTLESQKNQVLHNIGLIHTDLNQLNGVYNGIASELSQLTKTLEDKYGVVSVDLKDGSLTPIEINE